jgi:lactoylglutathione lyase
MTVFIYDHIHLKSPDPEKTALYYANMFGAEVLRLTYSDGQPRIGMKFGGVLFYISDTRGAPTGAGHEKRPFWGTEHIGFVVDDVETAAAELRSKGAVFSQEVHSPKPGVKNFYILAPENVHIEIINREADKTSN